MATTIGFDMVQKYLTGLAKLNGALAGSPHKAFWMVPYEQFISSNVPHVKYRGSPVPIIWKDAPVLSPLFMILVEPSGWGGINQMPEGGPFISDNDAGNSLVIPLDDGTTVTGRKVREDLETWFRNGFPKDPKPIP
jgi:hypothetical protein